MPLVGESDARRLRDPLFVLFILTGFAFGLGPLLGPKQFADLTGFLGTDTLVIRLAGCATLAYGVGFLLGFRVPWREIWIAVVAVCVFNLGSLVAGVAAVAAGSAPPIVYLVIVVSILFVAGSAWLLRQPPVAAGEPAVGSGSPDIAQWLLVLFIVGTAAALVFGLGPLILGGGFGRQLGYPGNDEWIYRQAGAATLGAGVGGLFAIRSRRWAEMRIASVMSLTFNATATFAALAEVVGGGAQPVAYLILVTAGLVSAGTIAALARNGR
jgi:hypothetical protein